MLDLILESVIPSAYCSVGGLRFASCLKKYAHDKTKFKDDLEAWESRRDAEKNRILREHFSAGAHSRESMEMDWRRSNPRPRRPDESQVVKELFISMFWIPLGIFSWSYYRGVQQAKQEVAAELAEKDSLRTLAAFETDDTLREALLSGDKDGYVKALLQQRASAHNAIEGATDDEPEEESNEDPLLDLNLRDKEAGMVDIIMAREKAQEWAKKAWTSARSGKVVKTGEIITQNGEVIDELYSEEVKDTL